MSVEEIIAAELQASRRIIRSGEALTPRFRIASPGGITHVVTLPLPNETATRYSVMQAISHFMAWKVAFGFHFAAESRAHDLHFVITVNRTTFAGTKQLIHLGTTITLGRPTKMLRDKISPSIVSLMPARSTSLSWSEIAELERRFGEDGETPAMRRLS